MGKYCTVNLNAITAQTNKWLVTSPDNNSTRPLAHPVKFFQTQSFGRVEKRVFFTIVIADCWGESLWIGEMNSLSSGCGSGRWGGRRTAERRSRVILTVKGNSKVERNTTVVLLL